MTAFVKDKGVRVVFAFVLSASRVVVLPCSLFLEQVQTGLKVLFFASGGRLSPCLFRYFYAISEF